MNLMIKVILKESISTILVLLTGMLLEVAEINIMMELMMTIHLKSSRNILLLAILLIFLMFL